MLKPSLLYVCGTAAYQSSLTSSTQDVAEIPAAQHRISECDNESESVYKRRLGGRDRRWSRERAPKDHLVSRLVEAATGDNTVQFEHRSERRCH